MQSTGPNAEQVPALGDRRPLLIDGLTLRSVHPTDFPQARDEELLELLRRAFNGGPSWFGLGVDPLDHLRWKVRDFPGLALFELIEDGDTVVGMQVHHGHRYLVHGHELLVSETVDIALDPGYQGRGINSVRVKLSRSPIATPEDQFRITLNSHPLSGRQLGRTAESELMGNQLLTLVRLISPTRLVWSRLSERLPRRSDPTRRVSQTRDVLRAQGVGDRAAWSEQVKAALALLGASVASSLRRTPSSSSWTIRTTREFDSRADRFWEHAGGQFDVMQIRDRRYLNWRFCDRRAGEFVVRTAEEDGELLGYLVLRVEGESALIMDLLALPDRTDVVESLIDDAVRFARRADAHQIRCWSVSGHDYLASLRRAGFTAYPNPMSFSYSERSQSRSELAYLSDPATRVHFQTADTDHI